ncbi:4'-phosphopantetheinyl transferase superfamily protein [Shewanella khirikhana]|uniref:4'-phosphopantetheinyl transferase family protein n=1 Tax=Shewanella khirikhana TaxID=1965282 RepID=UPI0030D03F97
MSADSDALQINLLLTLIALPPLDGAPGELDACLAPYLHWLSADEHERSQRARLPGLAARQLLVRLCLRAELARRTGQHPASLTFDYGPQGKPSLTQAGIQFNLSHSGDYLLIASTLNEAELLLGADIERNRANTDIDAIYRHYFSAPEQQYLERLAADAKRDGFFDLWALKESYIKATGKGLAEGLKTFGFDLATAKCSPDGAFIRFQDGLEVQRFPGSETQVSTDSITAECAETQTDPYAKWHWQSAVGQIDSEFRLAYTLATPTPRRCRLTLAQPQWQNLLQDVANRDASHAGVNTMLNER